MADLRLDEPGRPGATGSGLAPPVEAAPPPSRPGRAGPLAAIVALALGALLAFLLWAAPRGEDGIAWGDPMVPGGWMAWTLATALFFWVIAALILVFLVLAIRFPETPRVGVLRTETTRGDRLFIALLGSAFINLAWLGLLDRTQWGALLVCLAYALAVFRWV